MSFVAVVGRPNVGKSTIFNYLVGKRISIVEDVPGVTRDRIYANVKWLDHEFTLVDTGGLEPGSSDEMFTMIKSQADIAIREADVIMFVVDGRQGLTSLDEDVASILRATKKPLLLVVNKIDHPNLEAHASEFYQLGIDPMISISAANGLGIGDLLDMIVERLPDTTPPEYDEDVILTAVIGRPNVGKSSLVNAMLGQERVIVSNVPGTTRDAIDTPLIHGEDKFVLIDTAGLRKRNKVEEEIERYSGFRSIKAIERADIALMVIDASTGVTEQDKRIVGYAHDQGKGVIIVVNKWDIVDKDDRTMNSYIAKIRKDLVFLDYAPILFVSALTKQRVQRVLPQVKEVSEQQHLRLPTSVLNELISEATLVTPPPTDKGRRLKILYTTQVKVKPPTFVLFVNDPELLHFSYQRFLENQLRKHAGFIGTPIRIIARKRDRED